MRIPNLFLLAASWLCLLPHVSGQSPKTPPPNILFIITDQQTIDGMGCAGNPFVKTPGVDQLASKGVRFEKSYCTYPLCCPSRGSLFTSLTPHELGIYSNSDAELSSKNVPTMGELFKAGGYETAFAGKWHLSAPFPAFKGKKMPGFEVLPLAGKDPHSLYTEKDAKGLTVDPNTADAAISFLRKQHNAPFLLVVSILNPHDICEYPECEALRNLLPQDASKLPPPRPNLRDSETLPSALQKVIAKNSKWTEQQWQQYLWVYHRLVESADHEVARVLTALTETKLDSNTVVVFTSDHGEMMGSHGLVTKQRLYEESAAVPLVITTPETSARIDNQSLVSGLDIMPTLLDYAGIPAPASLRGKSLRPLVEGKAEPWREFVVSEVNEQVEARMVRTARFKYIIYADGDHSEQFFDMEKDPLELKNLIQNPTLADEISRHRKLLEQWRSETNDQIGRKSSGAKNKGEKEKREIQAPPQSSNQDSTPKPDSDRSVNFERRDKNHDGKLSLEEYLPYQKDQTAAQKRFQKWDVNNDGVLSKEEFLTEGASPK